MNHEDLSRDLAFAIGYYPESVRRKSLGNNEWIEVFGSWQEFHHYEPHWRVFDYRDPSVALAMVDLLGEYGAYLCKHIAGWNCHGRIVRFGDNSLLEAAARAVISLKGMK